MLTSNSVHWICASFFSRTFLHCQIYLLLDEYKVLALSTVRAGTGGDEAAIWTGDLVGTCFPLFLLFLYLTLRSSDLHCLELRKLKRKLTMIHHFVSILFMKNLKMWLILYFMAKQMEHLKASYLTANQSALHYYFACRFGCIRGTASAVLGSFLWFHAQR